MVNGQMILVGTWQRLIIINIKLIINELHNIYCELQSNTTAKMVNVVQCLKKMLGAVTLPTF